MAIWPFIISRVSREELGPEIVRHERIHFRQQIEMLLFPFFIWYFTEYLILLLRKKNKQQAYLSISFEQEAYANESDFQYLKSRKSFAWLKYLTHGKVR